MYVLYLNTMSPYAAKISAMIGYAGLPCRLEIQNVVNRFATIKRLTGKTMIPVLRRGEWAINDSSRIARHIIERSDRPLLPKDRALTPIGWLLEDFADEWLSLWVFLSRWNHDEDIGVASREIGKELTAGLPVVSRAVGRLAASGIQKAVERAGANESNRQGLERSRDRLLQALETLFEAEPAFVFEAYPTVADFALYGQLSQYARDPSGSDKMRIYPAVREYLERIDRMSLPEPTVELADAPARDIRHLTTLFAEFLGTYWRVLVENHRAYSAPKRLDEAEAELLDGASYRFRPSGYLVGRLEFVLSQLDRAYGERDQLFGGKGLEIEHALVQQVARLAEQPAGRNLLRNYPHIGKPASNRPR